MSAAAAGPKPPRYRRTRRLGPLLRAGGGRLEPIGRCRVEVRPPALPRARRSHSHEIEPQARRLRALAEQVLDLIATQRPVREPLAQGRRAAATSSAAGPQPSRSHESRRTCSMAAANGQSRARRPGGSSTSGAPLDDRASLERPGEVIALEALDARPQADVHRRCVLGLEPPCSRGRRAGSFARARAGAGERAARLRSPG